MAIPANPAMRLTKLLWERLHARQVACLPGASCLVAWGTWLGWIAFYHVNGWCWAIPANQGEISCENMASQGEFFCSFHLPMLSAEQKDSQSEEINVIVESQAENRSMPQQEAEIDHFTCCA